MSSAGEGQIPGMRAKAKKRKKWDRKKYIPTLQSLKEQRRQHNTNRKYQRSGKLSSSCVNHFMIYF